MTPNFNEIEKSALSLDKKNKARLIEKLLQSMRTTVDPEIEKAWTEEVNNRKLSLKSGEASLHSSKEVLNDARKQLNK